MHKKIKQMSVFLFTIIGLTCFHLTGKAEIMTSLTQRQQSIVGISALTAVGNWDKLNTTLHTALDNGLTVNEIKEILLQMYAYTGFPKSLNGINTLITVQQERHKLGIRDNAGPEPQLLPSETNRYAYGKSVVEKLFGPEKGKALYAISVPATDTFLKEHLFADIFSRGILSFQDRELATVSALAALETVEPMLQAHMTGALNTGLTTEQLNGMIDMIDALLGEEPANKARAILAGISGTQSAPQNMARIDTVFARGEKNPYGQFFTGQTYLQRLSEYDDIWHASIANVTFEPKARTNWHTHTGGQILLVTGGAGYYQEKGKAARRLRKGDVVRIPFHVEHWHGAAPDSWFSHISLETNGIDNKVDWLNPVTDTEYETATKGE